MPDISLTVKHVPDVLRRLAMVIERTYTLHVCIAHVVSDVDQPIQRQPEMKPLETCSRQIVLVIPCEGRHWSLFIDLPKPAERRQVYDQLRGRLPKLWQSVQTNGQLGQPSTIPNFIKVNALINHRQGAMLSAAKRLDRGRGVASLRSKLCGQETRKINDYQRLLNLSLLVRLGPRTFVNRQAKVTVRPAAEILQQVRKKRRDTKPIQFHRRKWRKYWK